MIQFSQNIVINEIGTLGQEYVSELAYRALQTGSIKTYMRCARSLVLILLQAPGPVMI